MATVDTNDLVSSKDIARLVGIGASAISNWKRRYADFPKPIATVANGRIALYRKSEVVQWFTARMDPEMVEMIREQR